MIPNSLLTRGVVARTFHRVIKRNVPTFSTHALESVCHCDA